MIDVKSELDTINTRINELRTEASEIERNRLMGGVWLMLVNDKLRLLEPEKNRLVGLLQGLQEQ
jgi:hypothetical protein